MGAYNTLSIDVHCLYCGKDYESRLQFKAGEVWQHHYYVGDRVQDGIDDRAISQVKIMAYGIVENEMCPTCGMANPEDYDILIDRGVIQEYTLLTDMSRYYATHAGNFYVVNEEGHA